MKVKTSELTGKALNWAVDWAEAGYPLRIMPHPGKPNEVIYYDTKHSVPLFDGVWQYSQEWNKGGPIIEREGILLRPIRKPGHSLDGQCLAMLDRGNTGSMVQWLKQNVRTGLGYEAGPTLLIAAMRCYVASKLGNEIDVPEDLLK